MINVVGYLGSFLLAICGLPLALEAYRTKKANISGAFLWVWFIGEVLTLLYVAYKKDVALIINYLTNIVFIGIVIFYKYFGKGRS